MRWVVRLVIVVLSVYCALAQPPDTLLLTPCQIASISSLVDLAPPTLWVRGTHLPHEMRTLDTIGATAAPDPLPDFTQKALSIAMNANNEYLFKRQIYSRYPQYDPEYSFDTALLGRAFEIARRLSNGSTRSMLFLAPSLRSPRDSVAILVTSRSLTSYGAFIGPVAFLIDSLRIIDDPAEVVPSTDGHARRSFAVRGAPVLRDPVGDSAAIALRITKSSLRDAAAFRLPLREELSR